jgi:ParB/RepB/Spo0J family partition protein
MNKPVIDLSMLDGPVAAVGAGTPLLLDLDKVFEDPNQPRKAFDDILELAESVAEHGVKVPISVRTHPHIDGAYMVKFGARRRRAALAAGLAKIPAWLDNTPSDIEQVVENLQRSALTPMELAQFMAEKLNGGMKQAEIARKLSIAKSAVSKYLALVDAPGPIEAVYRSGRNTSPDTLFELRTLYTRFPEQTAAWLTGDVEISRRSIDALKHTLIAGIGPAEGEGPVPGPSPKRRSTGPTDPNEIKRPIVAVKVGDRFGMIVLTRRANDDEHVLVKWDDSGEVAQVPCREIHLRWVDDARRYEPINRGLTPTNEKHRSTPRQANAHT